jgi:hypothetical protein
VNLKVEEDKHIVTVHFDDYGPLFVGIANKIDKIHLIQAFARRFIDDLRKEFGIEKDITVTCPTITIFGDENAVE